MTLLTSANLENPPAPPPVEKETEMPVWMQRLFMVVYVLFCIELGLVLVVLPWLPLWSDNAFLAHLPSARRILEHGFLRGAISGLGIIDIWLGISEAIHYRDRR